MNYDFGRLRMKATLSVRRLLGGSSAKAQFKAAVRSGDVVTGRASYGNPSVRAFITAGSEPPHLVVGNYCSIGTGVSVIVNGGHRTEWTTTFPVRVALKLPGAYLDGQPKPSGPVVIGHDVWVGQGATLLGGVNIGSGAVIGAGAVVASDVRPYAIVVGNPAREIRRRFDDEIVSGLLELEWWLLDQQQVAALVDVLCAEPDLDVLRERVAAARVSRTAN